MDNTIDQLHEQLDKMESLDLQMIEEMVRFSDPRWCSIARTHIEQGFMAARRALDADANGKRDGAKQQQAIATSRNRLAKAAVDRIEDHLVDARLQISEIRKALGLYP